MEAWQTWVNTYIYQCLDQDDKLSWASYVAFVWDRRVSTSHALPISYFLFMCCYFSKCICFTAAAVAVEVAVAAPTHNLRSARRGSAGETKDRPISCDFYIIWMQFSCSLALCSISLPSSKQSSCYDVQPAVRLSLSFIFIVFLAANRAAQLTSKRCQRQL